MKVGLLLIVLMLIPMAIIQAHYSVHIQKICEDPISDYEVEVLCKEKSEE